jgi:hypothetical protein
VEWDVKRLAASMLIAAADNWFAVKHQELIVLDTVRSYRSVMRKFAGMNSLEVWYADLDIQSRWMTSRRLFKTKTVARTDKEFAKARTHDSMSAFWKLTDVVDGNVRIVDLGPHEHGGLPDHRGSTATRYVRLRRGGDRSAPHSPPARRGCERTRSTTPTPAHSPSSPGT